MFDVIDWTGDNSIMATDFALLQVLYEYIRLNATLWAGILDFVVIGWPYFRF